MAYIDTIRDMDDLMEHVYKIIRKNMRYRKISQKNEII